MTKAITLVYEISHRHREKIFNILVVAILLTAFSYVFLLQRAIVNVVERQKVTEGTKALVVKVGGLEEKYFSIKNTITLDLAHSKGLKDAQEISYISKKAVTAMALPHEL